jgi:tetraacyldisaccharide 4'-kinase
MRSRSSCPRLEDEASCGRFGVSELALWRRRWYAGAGRQHRLRRPVISIGNLSHGGRGKTPVVSLLARWLVEAGERPAILTRGYARSRPEDGVVVVSDGRHLLADVERGGDEPLLLARDAPGACVVVSEQRALAGALAERALGATVHLLDDGFQHLQLARDLDVVIVTREDLADRPVPFGRLREPVAALAAADAVLMDGAAGPEGPGIRLQSGADAAVRFAVRREIGDPLPLEPERSWSAPDRRVVAVAGIARPQRFVESLRAAGWIVAEALTFGDHHRYTATDLAAIAVAANRAGAPVVTTAKDAARLLRLRPLTVPFAFVPLAVSVDPPKFREWVFERLAERRAGR